MSVPNPMKEFIAIGVQPENMIQVTPYQVGQRILSTTESFQNKAPDTGMAAAPSQLRFPDADQSAAPSSSNFNALTSQVQLPRTQTSGMLIQGPNDGPTELLRKAEQVENAYNIAIINQVNRMLATENYSGAEKLLGRELTTEEIQNRQLGARDRYTNAKAGAPPNPIPSQIIQMPQNASNPPALSGPALSNVYSTDYAERKAIIDEWQLTKSEKDYAAYLQSERSKDLITFARNTTLDQPGFEQTKHQEEARLAQRHEQLKNVEERINRKTGHGIAFGRFHVHPGKLEEGVLSMKYAHNGKKVSDLPNKQLSPALQEAVRDVIHNKPTSGTGLSDDDVNYLHKIVHRSQSGGEHNIPIAPGQQRRSRMMVIMGEMQAGNDNPQLKTELAKILKLLTTSQQLSAKDALLIRRSFL